MPHRVIAFVTCARLPDLTVDDRAAAAALEARGAQVVPAVWTNPGVAWGSFDAVIIRSTWDYHQHGDAFLTWVARLESGGARLWNAPSILRWNFDKGYLEDLRARHLPTFRSRRVPRGAAASLGSVLAEEGWSDAVVKPAVSGGAFRTFRAKPGEGEDEWRALLAVGDALVQRFEPGVVEEGEWSFCFFAGTFSHAVLKRPRAGDFRVQQQHGGSHSAVSAPPHLVAQAGMLLRAGEELAGARTLYARIDGIQVAGALHCMELEFIEPSLFFDADPRAPDRFTDAVLTLPGRG